MPFIEAVALLIVMAYLAVQLEGTIFMTAIGVTAWTTLVIGPWLALAFWLQGWIGLIAQALFMVLLGSVGLALEHRARRLKMGRPTSAHGA